jgi:hypothetical protein
MDTAMRDPMNLIPPILFTIAMMIGLTIVILSSGGSAGDAALLDASLFVGSVWGAYLTRDDWR